jgi:hypothetical protein
MNMKWKTVGRKLLWSIKYCRLYLLEETEENHKNVFFLIPSCHSTICDNVSLVVISLSKESKAIPVTGRGGLFGCETSRLSHFPDNRVTEGGTIVSLTLYSPETLFFCFWYSFMLGAE